MENDERTESQAAFSMSDEYGPLLNPAEQTPIPPPLPVKDGSGGSAWKTFFSLTGGCILYCLSALSIVYGLVQVINPVLLGTGDTWTRLSCMGALNGYELAVLGVLLLIVLWRSVLDDAISLVIIIAILLLGNAMAVDMIVMDNRSAGFPVGLVCLALAGANVIAFRRYLRMHFDPVFLVGLGIMLAWSMLMPSVLAWKVHNGLALGDGMRNAWLKGWGVMLAGGALWWLQAVRTRAGQALDEHRDTPFLRTSSMAWIFAAITLVGMTIQQYALTYVFDLNFCVAALLPIIALTFLVGLELLYAYGARDAVNYYVVSLAPLFVCLFVFVKGVHIEGPAMAVSPFWNPPWLMAIIGLGVAASAFVRRRRGMWAVAGAYALACWMTLGMPGGEGSDSLKWIRGLGVIELAVIVLSVRLRNPSLAGLAWIGAGLACCVTGTGTALADKLGLDSFVLGKLVALGGLVSLEAIFGRRLNPLFFIVACFLVVQVLFAFGLENGPHYHPWASALVVAALGGLVAWRAGNFIVLAVLCFPLLRALYFASGHFGGWGYVMLSFPLLAAGAYLSLRKGRLKGTGI